MTASFIVCQSAPSSPATSLTRRPARPTCSVAHRPARSVTDNLRRGDPRVLIGPATRPDTTASGTRQRCLRHRNVTGRPNARQIRQLHDRAVLDPRPLTTPRHTGVASLDCSRSPRCARPAARPPSRMFTAGRPTRTSHTRVAFNTSRGTSESDRLQTPSDAPLSSGGWFVLRSSALFVSPHATDDPVREVSFVGATGFSFGLTL